MKDELNPNHPVTAQMHDMWHKVALLLMRRVVEAEGVDPSPDAAVVHSARRAGRIFRSINSHGTARRRASRPLQ